MPTAFDLEKAVAAWRRPYEHNRAFSEEDLEELEGSLRDRVDVLVEAGLPEETAFQEALRRMGSYGTAEAEYRKVYWGKRRRRGEVLHELYWRAAMWKNHLKIALRQLKRRPLYTAINVLGLAVGMACCLLILLYMQDELSFDRFHEKADRLFVVPNEHPVEGRALSTSYSLASVLESLPDVEQTTRFWPDRERPVMRKEVQRRANQHILLAEPSFFDMFSFPAVTGDPAAVLNTPDGAVISESLARMFFGEENPIRKTLEFEHFGDNIYSVTVGAVVKDVPRNSSIRFDLVAPLSLLGDESYLSRPGFFFATTCVQTKTAIAVETLNRKIAETQPEKAAVDGWFASSALPLPALYLSGLTADGLKGQPKFLYLFGSIALVVLLISVVNYVNLVTVQATQRAREVGVRKALGAGRSQLARQFLGESILLSITALGVSLMLTGLALPAFSRLFDKELAFWGAEYGFVLPLMAGFVLAVAVMAGAYPAFMLSRFQPAAVLRGAGVRTTPARRLGLRQSLVVFQFTVSVTLIIVTAIIYHQLGYLQNKDLGFNGEQVVVVDLPRSVSASVRESLKQRVLSHPGVVGASLANGIPGRFQMGYGRPVDEAAPQNRTDAERVRFRPAVVDYDFIPTLRIPVLAGRSFSPDFPADVSRAYILNRAAAERLGWSPEEAVGQTFKLGPAETPEGEIIGVVEDFHIASLHQEIEPVVLQLHTLSPVGSLPFKLVARLVPEQIRNAVGHIEQQYSQVTPDASFQYTFLDEVFDAMYRAEERLSRIFTSFAVLAILIACLGLFGLAAYAAETRTKEIGIRKVLGATISNLVLLLSRDFLKLVAIAFFLAAPLAYVAMSRWLEDFAYRIELGPGPFVLTGALVLAIALLTVGYQAIKAAHADPVKSLRYE